MNGARYLRTPRGKARSYVSPTRSPDTSGLLRLDGDLVNELISNRTRLYKRPYSCGGGSCPATTAQPVKGRPLEVQRSTAIIGMAYLVIGANKRPLLHPPTFVCREQIAYKQE